MGAGSFRDFQSDGTHETQLAAPVDRQRQIRIWTFNWKVTVNWQHLQEKGDLYKSYIRIAIDDSEMQSQTLIFAPIVRWIGERDLSLVISKEYTFPGNVVRRQLDERAYIVGQKVTQEEPHWHSQTSVNVLLLNLSLYKQQSSNNDRKIAQIRSLCATFSMPVLLLLVP